MKPGEDIIVNGLRDLESGRETVSALLVLIGAPRLRNIGHNVPITTIANPEHQLYLMLQAEDADSAHSRYNAWIRRLVSYERAAERELSESENYLQGSN